MKRYMLGMLGVLIVLSGCAGSYPEPVSRSGMARKSKTTYLGVVYSLKNRSNEGEIIATLLFSGGKTRYAGVIGVSCNGKAIALLKDDRLDRKRVYLYSLCHRSGIINGLVVPPKTTPDARFFLVGTYLGSWNAGLYRDVPDDMVLSPDGRYLYTGGERGTIIGFRVRRSGQLEKIGLLLRKPLPAEDRILSLGINANGEDLVASVENRGQSFLKEFRIDPDSGRLHPEGKSLSVPGPVHGLVAPDSLMNGNILGGILTGPGTASSVVTFETGDAFGRSPVFVRAMSRSGNTILHQVLFTPDGTSLFVSSTGGGDCSGHSGEIRRYFVEEYGKRLHPGPSLCTRVGGGVHNAGWDWKDRLLLSGRVLIIPEDPERSPKPASGRVEGDHGIVFVPAGGKGPEE